MARLGVWTRLGIVASALAMLIAPIVVVYRESAAISELNSIGYRACMRGLADTGAVENYAAGQQRCLDTHLRHDYSFASVWQGAALAVAAIVLLCWILTGIAVFTIRWILAGRKKV